MSLKKEKKKKANIHHLELIIKTRKREILNIGSINKLNF